MSESGQEKPIDYSNHEWLIRPCEIYSDEYSECKSFKARFHQYFIHGETTDCTQWKKDLDNCYRWTEKNDNIAKEKLMISEQERRTIRLKAHYGNTTWERRSAPPSDWNKPLPEWLQKRYENSYLSEKVKEMKGEPNNVALYQTSTCSIM